MGMLSDRSQYLGFLHCYLLHDCERSLSLSHSDPDPEVMDFLKSLKLDKYAKKFEENQIDVEMLLSITAHKDVLKILEELGVEKAADRRRIKTRFKEFCSAHSRKTD